MALNKNALSNIRCEIYNELDNDGIDEYRFRVFDQNDEVILSSSTRYYTPQAAIDELNQAVENIRNNPKAFQIKQAKNGKWYFNIIDAKGEIIARRIEYYSSQKALFIEIERVKKLFIENELD